MPGIIAIGASHGGLEKGLDLIQPTAADGIEALQRVFALPRACIARGGLKTQCVVRIMSATACTISSLDAGFETVVDSGHARRIGSLAGWHV